MKTRILLIIISFVTIFCSCKKDDPGPAGPFDIEVNNYTCTSWTYTENGTVINTIDKSCSDDSYTNTSFIAEKGKHTYNFSPEPDTCFFPGSFFGYVYKQADLTINIENDGIITIGIYFISYLEN